MEILFSNHCTLTEKMYENIYAQYVNQLWVFILSAILGAYGIFLVAAFWGRWGLTAIGCVLLLEVVFLCFFSTKYKARKAFRRQCARLHVDVIENDTLFMEEAFQIIDPLTGRTMMLDYSQIHSIKELANHQLLVLKNRHFICIDKNKFLIGELTKFDEFIRKKCPRAVTKPPWKRKMD